MINDIAVRRAQVDTQFQNRYVPPLGFAILLFGARTFCLSLSTTTYQVRVAFHDPAWTANNRLCNAIAFFPGILGTFTFIIIDSACAIVIFGHFYSLNQ